HNLSQDFIRLQVMLAFVFSLRNYEKPVERQFPFSISPQQTDLCAVGNQRRSNAGRAHEFRRTIVPQNCVIAIFAHGDHVLTRFIFRDKTEATPEIPAARALTEVSAESRHVTNLWARSFV